MWGIVLDKEVRKGLPDEVTSEQRRASRRGKPGKGLGGEHARQREQPARTASSWGMGGTHQSSQCLKEEALPASGALSHLILMGL